MRAVRAAVVVVASVLLAACGSTVDAGTRVTPGVTDPATDASSPAASAPADLVAAAHLGDCPASDRSVAPRDDGLPDITLACLGHGPAVRLAGLRGTPTVLNVWASWCGPCRTELPLFADLATTAGRTVRVMGLDASDDAPSALSLLTGAGVHYPSARDDSGLTRSPLSWGSGLPVTYFVDADGAITYAQHGAITSAEQLRSLVSDHLGVTVPA